MKDHRDCTHHFNPSTICTALYTTKLLPVACTTINFTKCCRNEIINASMLLTDQSNMQQLSNNAYSDSNKEKDGHCKILEQGQCVDTDRFQRRWKRETVVVEDPIEIKKHKLATKSALN